MNALMQAKMYLTFDLLIKVVIIACSACYLNDRHSKTSDTIWEFSLVIKKRNRAPALHEFCTVLAMHADRFNFHIWKLILVCTV